MMHKTCYNCFKILSDKHRMMIVAMLKQKKLTVSDLSKDFNIGQPTISHHLAVLRKFGMVMTKKQGREILYSFNSKHPCHDCGIFKNLKTYNAQNK